jgi:hypothetical protein
MHSTIQCGSMYFQYKIEIKSIKFTKYEWNNRKWKWTIENKNKRVKFVTFWGIIVLNLCLYVEVL